VSARSSEGATTAPMIPVPSTVTAVRHVLLDRLSCVFAE